MHQLTLVDEGRVHVSGDVRGAAVLLHLHQIFLRFPLSDSCDNSQLPAFLKLIPDLRLDRVLEQR